MDNIHEGLIRSCSSGFDHGDIVGKVWENGKDESGGERYHDFLVNQEELA